MGYWVGISTLKRIGYYNNYIKKVFSCFILNSQFLNLEITQPIYTPFYALMIQVNKPNC